MAETKEQEFWVDFETWIIQAKDENEAMDKAIALIRNGERPKISQVEAAETRAC